MKKLKAKLILLLMSTKFYAWLVIKVIPYIRFSLYYTSLRGWKYMRGYKILKTGDILLTTDKKKLTSFLIPGDFTHAALCVDKGSEWEISEMTHTNYTKSTFFDLCKEADRVKILRCKDWDDEYIKEVVEKCKSFENVPYDIYFTLGVKALSCAEMVYESDFRRKLKVDLSDVVGIGKLYLSPTGIEEAENGYAAWDSDMEIPPN